MRLAIAVLVSLLLGAKAPVPVRVCPVLSTSAKPILQVAGSGSRAPLSMYPVGFSSEGRFAWLELRQGFDSELYVWLLHIIDLSNDHILVEESYFTATTSLQAMCKQHGAVIAKLLDKNKIERGAPISLEQPDEGRDPTGVTLVAGRRDSEASKTPYSVYLHGKAGAKKLGVLWRVEVDSGQPPLGVPKFRGILRSPTEPRVAVLVTQQMIGTEGVDVTMVNILGGRLDKGWREQP